MTRFSAGEEHPIFQGRQPFITRAGHDLLVPRATIRLRRTGRMLRSVLPVASGAQLGAWALRDAYCAVWPVQNPGSPGFVHL